MRDAWIDFFLALAWLSTVFSVAGLWVMKDFYERLHFMTPTATFGIWALAAAVVVRSGSSSASLKAVFCVLLIFFMNPVLTHATARAARIHVFGRWQPRPDEKIPIVGTHRYVGEKK